MTTTPPAVDAASWRDSLCPGTRRLFEHLTSKWGVLVLVTLADQTMRWSALKRAIDGVSEKMLIQTLQTLEADGLIRRDALPVVPPHVEYSLTGEGRSAVTLLVPPLDWSREHVGSRTPS
jgi:DNA-binding HxlR family transcriptional regulator